MTMPGKFQSVVDAQIRAAEARGAFDNLPGAGKPIPGLMEPDDPMWWIKGFVRREGVPAEAMLPPSLAMRREVERLPETVRVLRSERAVREHVEELNHRIRRWIQIPVGPQVPLRPVDVDEVVAAWQQARRPAAQPGAGSGPAPGSGAAGSAAAGSGAGASGAAGSGAGGSGAAGSGAGGSGAAGPAPRRVRWWRRRRRTA